MASLAGGRHPGHGTGNRIVPLGPDYLELMAVVDPAEAATSPLGRWAQARAHQDAVPTALCLRTDEIGRVGSLLGEQPLAMSRRTPTGAELSWHLAGLEGMLARGDPFFIEWHCAAEDHPGTMDAPHLVEPTGVGQVTAGVSSGLADLAATVPGLVATDRPGVQTMSITTLSGSIELGPMG